MRAEQPECGRVGPVVTLYQMTERPRVMSPGLLEVDHLHPIAGKVSLVLTFPSLGERAWQVWV